MNHPSAECSRLVVHRSRLPEHAIKSPINVYFSLAGVPQHPHEPILHRAAIEIFDDVKHFHNGLERV